jgi:hypothetical protein
MPTDQSPLDRIDRMLVPLTRDLFERDLRNRIAVAMERQLPIFLAAENSHSDLAEAA